jgi:predicted DNA-binding transcriptional regulator AlpA
MESKYLTVKQVSALLELHPDTLRKWRNMKKGPPFFRYEGGIVKYPRIEFNEWLQNQRSSK